MAPSARRFGEAMDTTLPQELVAMVKDFDFTRSQQAKVSVAANHCRPPSDLQVKRAHRLRLLTDYYRYTTFEVDNATICIRWLESLSIELQLRIYTIRLGDPPAFSDPRNDAAGIHSTIATLGNYNVHPRLGGPNAGSWRDRAFRKQHEAIKTRFRLPGHSEATPRLEWTYYYRHA
ncbi:hypothetical protein B0A48_04755 [Cryoendolithus antarcticus]|uniref:Uncharacterized protein n=1 Tax=Cryoendolithus antarcticus TaxID=1507870 RepID=A0A1V8TD79_9PEZI|nr:hypothetical protein B0A48_04755 [Cryoendolithus antarcticus]